jgi:hypothetical protein
MRFRPDHDSLAPLPQRRNGHKILLFESLAVAGIVRALPVVFWPGISVILSFITSDSWNWGQWFFSIWEPAIMAAVIAVVGFPTMMIVVGLGELLRQYGGRRNTEDTTEDWRRHESADIYTIWKVILIVRYYLSWYDSTYTFRPDWMDWLG